MGKRKNLLDHPELLGMPEVRKLWQTEDLAASRAALIATAIRAGKLDASLADLRLIPSDKKLLKTLRIDGPWNKLYKLRKFNVEAFYNWHQAERFSSG